jgi:co-chaperonin GroES (HSP10)
MATLRPKQDRVMVKRIEEDGGVSPDGVVLQAPQDGVGTARGTVMAVGKLAPPVCKVGDIVVFRDGLDVTSATVENEAVLIMGPDNILEVLEGDA